MTWQGVLGTSDGVLPPFTTSAQAEGAIEGVYTEYIVGALGQHTGTRFNRFSNCDASGQDK